MVNFDEKIRELVAHAYEKAPAITGLLDEAGVKPGDIQSPSDLSKIPITHKDELVEIHKANPPFGGFLTVDPITLPRIYISPGPIFDPQLPGDNPALLAPFEYVGFGPGDRVLNTFMYHLTPAGLLLDEALQAMGATVLPTGPGNTELQIMMMQSLGATGFVGQPSYLMTLLDKAAEMSIGPDALPLKKALFSAEPYTPTQQARFENEYGMKTTSAYGTADVGIIGYTATGVEGFILMPHVYVEAVDPETGEQVAPGEIGEMVVTTFNKSYPLIRFGTGDLGALAAEPHPMAKGGQQLLGLYGRSGDAVKVRGMFLHPSQLKAASTYIPEIKALQAIITRPENKDIVTLKVELQDGGENLEVAEKLKALAQQAVRLRIDHVIFDTVNANERTIKDDRVWD